MILKDYDFGRYTIQDPIHGAITFGVIEKAVIDHRLFQRLHGLRQNSLLYLVFPSANHTRFDHSVGVMHLAGKFLDCIVRNQFRISEAGASRDCYQGLYRVDCSRIKRAVDILADDRYFMLTVRLAGLFHDIGHGPLSHLFDKFFPSGAFLQQLTRPPEYAHISSRLSRLSPDAQKMPVTHEVLSCVIATRVLFDLSNLLAQYGIGTEQVVRDVCSVIDAKVTPSDSLLRTPYKIHRLLHDIVSGEIDADRMDYLLRDSHMCGVNFGLYDPDRILKSMCMYGRSDTRILRVAVRYSGLGALEDLLLARYQMYAHIYGHKTNRACNSMLERIRARLQKSKWKWYDRSRTSERLLETFSLFDDQKFINTLLDAGVDNGAGKVKEIAEKLFLERKLYKRVFEERAVSTELDSARDEVTRRRWKRYQRILKDKKIRFAPDVFENKGPKVKQANYPLKVLRKHPVKGYYMVHELEDFSTVAQYLPEKENTYRVYCKSIYVSRARPLLEKVISLPSQNIEADQ